MPSIIRVLDEHTINKIAAGEVVENAASVVKELVENSIDAGASEICVEIKGGGRQLIRVTDNGCGMNRDDAVLCLERHATSKIRSIDDMNLLGTMGFRGEAIPSIAAISKFTLLTATEEGNGTLVLVDGGRITQCGDAACARGTTIEVKSLFFNVPARKKFQRSPNYDTGEVLKVVTQQALAYPDVRFELIGNQQSLLVAHRPDGTSFQEKLQERITTVLGIEYQHGLCPLEGEKDSFHLAGFMGMPGYNRHNRAGQHLFINKRAVTSPLVAQAVREGYGTSLASNRHPVFVLHLTTSGTYVDVNVHPQKRVVRLRQEQQLRDLIRQSVEKALQNGGFAHAFALPHPHEAISASTFFSRSPSSDFLPEPKKEREPWTPKLMPQPVAAAPFEDLQMSLPVATRQALEEKRTPLRVIATLPGYLVASSSEGRLHFVDQKAAHSRILFEQLMQNDNANGPFPTQQLLLPHRLELSAADALIVQEHMKYLLSLGLQIKEFGSGTFVIDAVPQIWADVDLDLLLEEVVKSLQGSDDCTAVDKGRAMRLAQGATHAVIPQKKRLTTEQGQALLNQLMRCATPSFCPHGKPTLVEITQETLSKHF